VTRRLGDHLQQQHAQLAVLERAAAPAAMVVTVAAERPVGKFAVLAATVMARLRPVTMKHVFSFLVRRSP